MKGGRLPRRIAKQAVRAVATALVMPAAAACWIEGRIDRRSEWVFSASAQLLALVPGPPGAWLRCAFYCMTLDGCTAQWWMGFGSVFTHRRARVERDVYIGSYALIGSAHLAARCLIGSRVSIVSGGIHHEIGDDGSWTSFDLTRTRPIAICADAWIGEGAIISGDVGSGALVACGAVVGSTVPAGAVFAGNPARFVRMLSPVQRSTGAKAQA